ncbi:hypothetical protein AB1L88_16500 [Tautonia sp. JC769]|uniref:hypothetical protein n=1 Tax=Tautonia sp. JC769 TaxID=3232135 RepID=UPI00345A0198
MNQCESPRDLSSDKRGALAEELKNHIEYSRRLFSIFVTWWTFVCTTNIAALGAVLATPDVHKGVAPAIAFFDLLGTGFCLLISMRFVQIQDRVTKVLHAQFGPTNTPPLGPNLPRTPTVSDLARGIVRGLAPEQTGEPLEPHSPIPLSFYLWCTVPVMILGCPIIAGLWLVGLGWPHWLTQLVG